MQEEQALVIVQREGRVGIVTLNRPKQLNALNDALMDALGEALLALDADPGIGAILLAGGPRAFAAGADIAVCGFDDVPSSIDVTPALTTVRVPLSDVGYQAFRATVDADWEQPPLPLEVVVRDSTPGLVR